MVRDSQRFVRSFTVPVTPPRSKHVPPRVIGRIYIASQIDLPVFLKMRKIFPELSGWSKLKLRFASSEKQRDEWFAQVSEVDFTDYLLTCAFALDRHSIDPGLPFLTARAGVPLIGSKLVAEQMRFWPRLAVDAEDSGEATEKFHWMLTDHAAVREVCEFALEATTSIPNKRSGNDHSKNF
jgi:hypothetical protein